MKLHYFPETDSLYIDFSERTSADSLEVSDGVVVDFDERGDVVGLEVQHAAQKFDLDTLEAVDLPLRGGKRRAAIGAASKQA